MNRPRWIAIGVAALAALAFSTTPASAGSFVKKHHVVHVPHKGGASFQFSLRTSRHGLHGFKRHGFRHHRGFLGFRAHRFGHRGFRHHGFKPHHLRHHRFKHHRFGQRRFRHFRHRW
ncbi:MAG: hypothetical protein GWN84_19710 [Gammaproteobacteria bacterium]|nr:hypothetical protein [Gammaproteobacteria bacterium]NIR85054.1 hypothetical protein [Gammaproteobacteria bacterium]NIR88321.1 hypothetical protein [Gammaproteobacteria bacterium]NIU06101.1 hypothetical protein [Gammaproteobacteria bacterium]NIV73520.1 hypothetical protein [Gammaproteobacteria bacterium]